MTQLPPDFKEFLRLLNSKEVEYLIVGGYAVGYYGFPRATGDIDIWIAISATNAEKTVNALKEFGFLVPGLSTELFLEPDRIVRMGMPPFRIEILTSISGVEFNECYLKRTNAVLDTVPVSLIDIDNLKLNKQASGRPKDLNDLLNLS